MKPLADGISVLFENWQLTGVILISVLASQYFLRLLLRATFKDNLTPDEQLSLGISGWIAPLLLISMIWILWGMEYTLPFGLSLILAIFLLIRFISDLIPGSNSTSLIFALALSIFILLRLAYLSEAIFPSYFDPARHYTLIQTIISNKDSNLFHWLTFNYYHLGFHYLTVSLALFFDFDITRVMLVLGQVILALIPFSLYFPIRYATKSGMAAWFAVVLAAFGWYMPAHAVDWGKYPALMSLGLIPFVLNLSYLAAHQNTDSRRLPARTKLALFVLLAFGVLLTVFAHSRSLIVLGVVAMAWVVFLGWQKLSQRAMFFVFIFVILVTLGEVVYIQRQSILALLVDPYIQNGILVTVLVLTLSIFAWMAYPGLTFVIVLTVAFLLGSVFIPVTFLPGYGDLTLLDRPYVEMILFMPLSVLGGLGLAGLEKKLQGRFALSRLVGVLAIGIVLVNAYFKHDLYPSDCCVIVGNDDVVAMDWVAKQLPVEARIGISSTQLKVLTSETSEGDVGADAGIWVTPLTGRVTIPLPYNTDFSDPVAWKSICEKQIGYLFVGQVGYPFDGGKIDAAPERYRPLLFMPKTRVYEVVGCN